MGKKWMAGILAALAVSYLGLWPFEAVDAGQLYMVETLLISEREGEISVETKDAAGTGDTLEAAVENLAKNTPGQLFLRQTKRMIFCGGAETEVNLCAMPEDLPVGVIVYRSGNTPEALKEDFDNLEKRLAARERRDNQLATLGSLQNEVYEKEGEPVA